MDKKILNNIGEKNKQVNLLKVKINKFLIEYFNYIIFSFSIIILIIGLFIFIYPKYKKIYEENERIKNNMQVEYEKKINYLNSIQQLKTIYQSISENDKNKISIMLPTSKDSSIIIAEIESIITKNSAILNSIKVETQATGARSNYRAQTSEDKISLAGIFSNPPQEIGLIKIEIKLSSVDYQILKNIIKTFENNLRLFDISKVSFNVGKSEAVLNIYTYYLQQ